MTNYFYEFIPAFRSPKEKWISPDVRGEFNKASMLQNSLYLQYIFWWAIANAHSVELAFDKLFVYACICMYMYSIYIVNNRFSANINKNIEAFLKEEIHLH